MTCKYHRSFSQKMFSPGIIGEHTAAERVHTCLQLSVAADKEKKEKEKRAPMAIPLTNPSHRHCCFVDWRKKSLQDERWSASSGDSLPVATPTQVLSWFTPCIWRSDDKSFSSATARKVDVLGQITFPSRKLYGKEVLSIRIGVACAWLSLCST